MNMHMPVQQRQYLRVPYFIDTWLSLVEELPTNYLDHAWMEHTRTRLDRTQQLWEESESCTQLLERVSTGARRLETPVTKLSALDSTTQSSSGMVQLSGTTLGRLLDGRLHGRHQPRPVSHNFVYSDHCPGPQL
jgi:hypothetical protein